MTLAWQAPNSSVDESWRFGILVCWWGDSRWVRDSKTFLSSSLVLAGLFLGLSDLFVASGCPASRVGRWLRFPQQLGLPASYRCACDFSETHHRRLSAP